jgi:hypothetical protein
LSSISWSVCLIIVALGPSLLNLHIGLSKWLFWGSFEGFSELVVSVLWFRQILRSDSDYWSFVSPWFSGIWDSLRVPPGVLLTVHLAMLRVSSSRHVNRFSVFSWSMHTFLWDVHKVGRFTTSLTVSFCVMSVVVKNSIRVVALRELNDVLCLAYPCTWVWMVIRMLILLNSICV